MKLCTFLFTFSVTVTFVPLDYQMLIIDVEHARTKWSKLPMNRSTHTMTKSIALNRVKRTIHRPEKWEAIINEIERKPKSRRNTRFFLYTRRNREKGQEICIDDYESLLHSNFDPNKRVIFLISGWLDNRYFAKWVREAFAHLLDRDDFNVIYVAWRSIKELFVAAILIKMYSEDLAQFIDFIKSTHSISGQSIHCIGHSLGAFLCAFAGDLTHIGRVSVLDAGPRPWYQRTHWSKRINRYQADFIDVIHSDFSPGFSLGLTIPLGDIDFFPNSGTVQDGCWKDKWNKPFNELWDEGLLVSLDQLASCEDIWFDGHGESTCALMGYDAEYAILNQGLTKYSPQGRWFIKTSDFLSQTNRHCQYQYQIVIKFGNLVPSVQNGTFVVTMVSAKERTLRPITQELVSPNSAGIRSNYMLTKLILRPHSLPLSRISALYLSFNPHEKDKLWKNTVKLPTMLPVLWVKLSPIHVLNNSPIFFCNFKLSLNLDKSIQLKRCDSV
ncbi:hypothetical protein RDWZM_007391 [Blomia tropicalis]|uniref:Lipase domain-containing protein n=1 Tax=Blomia tropicalis TaxID=40697 RepID=A0A9Q0RIZ8_BLOTA|nr:hypothetical protein RDWZM_007391 [Blomia tropicalis]